MKICVTGSSGQIGSYVVDAARAQGHDVVGLDLRPSPWTARVGDIRDAVACRDALAGCDAVIHCAAQVSVQSSVTDPVNDINNNIVGTATLLKAAISQSVPRFLFTSSAAVYGEPQNIPISEEHPVLPLSPYGASKAAGEHYVRILGELSSIETVIVRPFNVYSIRQDPANPYTGVLSHFLRRVTAGLPPRVYGDGSQTRDFVHAADVARWMLKLIQVKHPHSVQCFNIGSGKETSISALARMFTEAAGLDSEPEYEPARPGEIHRSVADVTRLRKIGGQGMRLEDGVKLLVSAVSPMPRVRAR